MPISNESLQVLHATARRYQKRLGEMELDLQFAGGNPVSAIRALDRAIQEIEVEATERVRATQKQDQEEAKAENEEAAKPEG